MLELCNLDNWTVAKAEVRNDLDAQVTTVCLTIMAPGAIVDAAFVPAASMVFQDIEAIKALRFLCDTVIEHYGLLQEEIEESSTRPPLPAFELP